MFASFYEKLNSIENCYKKCKKFMNSKLPNSGPKQPKFQIMFFKKKSTVGLY